MQEIPLKSIPKNNYEWMNNFRGAAALFICIHHWFARLYDDIGISFIDTPIHWFTQATGSVVQLFFVLSGAGLVVSYFKKPVMWSDWAKKRFIKIIIPYWVVVCFTFFLTQLLHHLSPAFFSQVYFMKDLGVYIFLLQNFIPMPFYMVSSLWYIPNIIGLYFVFPLILKFNNKFGTISMLLVSFVVSIGSTALVIMFGGNPEHHKSVFLFFVFLFALGMVLGQKSTYDQNFLQKISSFKAAIIGLLFYFASWALQQYYSNGSYFNNALTVLGLLPIGLCFFRVTGNSIITRIFQKISKCSYYFYLIHVPILIYIIKPIAKFYMDKFIYHILFFICGIVFVLFIYFLSKWLTNTTNFMVSLAKQQIVPKTNIVTTK
ncbi:MAG: Acyltransferase family protein [Bacteroidetes bacterium ADurb.Bin302]|nr:MAG: Acyltransferase family protein [Bacteroidetes bacterium ADurb.Bin302]